MKKALLFIIFLMGSQVFTQDMADFGISIKYFINDISAAGPPKLYNAGKKYILFTYKHGSKEIIHNIDVVFQHEDFRINHYMKKNQNGIYFVFYEVSDDILYKKQELNYSFIIDGVWSFDPNNPVYYEKVSGYKLSVFNSFKETLLIPTNSPILKEKRGKLTLVEFYYVTDPGKVIYISGNFNGWDPYMYPMEENTDSPGTYKASLYFKNGEFFYNFIEDGIVKLDPQNKKIMYMRDRNNASILQVN